jgi:hypothetical protein
MHFFLPEKRRKMIRYCGIYASNIEKKPGMVDKYICVKSIEHSSGKKPEA